MLTTSRRKVLLANIIGVRADMILTPRGEGEDSRQVDMWIERRRGWKKGIRMRLGYWDHNTFWRANPVNRVLHEHGVQVSEGEPDEHSEPQYDMIYTFTEDGKLLMISDNRTSMVMGVPADEIEEFRRKFERNLNPDEGTEREQVVEQMRRMGMGR